MLEEASEYLGSVSSILSCTCSQLQAFLLQLWPTPVVMLAQHGHLPLTAVFVGFQDIKLRKCSLARRSISTTNLEGLLEMVLKHWLHCGRKRSNVSGV